MSFTVRVPMSASEVLFRLEMIGDLLAARGAGIHAQWIWEVYRLIDESRKGKR